MRICTFRADFNHSPPYMVALFADGTFRSPQWETDLRELSELLDSSPSQLQAFIITDGALPSPIQRRQLWATMSERTKHLLAHVFTTSAAVRGVVTVYHWTTRGEARCHPPEKFSEVCRAACCEPNTILAMANELAPLVGELRILNAIRAGCS